MTAKEYKVVIGVLLVTNIIGLIIIFVLCGEINLLQDKVSEMSGAIRALNEKISNIELVQENLQNEKVMAKGNKYIFGGIFTIVGIVILGYFGGINPGNLGKVFDLSADRLTDDVVSQNEFISKNLKLCLQSIDFMNKKHCGGDRIQDGLYLYKARSYY